MTVDTRHYQISIDKIAVTINDMLLRGETPIDICSKLSCVSGIPVIVMYYWFYKNKNSMVDEIKRISTFYGYDELLDENGNNVLISLENI